MLILGGYTQRPKPKIIYSSSGGGSSRAEENSRTEENLSVSGRFGAAGEQSETHEEEYQRKSSSKLKLL